MTSPSSVSYMAGTSVAIVFSVILVLLLFAIVLYLFHKWKQNKHDHNSASDPDNLNNRQLDHTAEDYEEIKTYNCHAYPNAVYNNVEIPTYPSASPTEPEHIAEDFGNVKDRECSDNTSTEEPTGPTDPSADPTQSIDYITVNFLQNELEAASS
ncbi:uncharacterized protein Hap1MRO34_020612 [Clarias gariepinus]